MNSSFTLTDASLYSDAPDLDDFLGVVRQYLRQFDFEESTQSKQDFYCSCLGISPSLFKNQPPPSFPEFSALYINDHSSEDDDLVSAFDQTSLDPGPPRDLGKDASSAFDDPQDDDVLEEKHLSLEEFLNLTMYGSTSGQDPGFTDAFYVKWTQHPNQPLLVRQYAHARSGGGWTLSDNLHCTLESDKTVRIFSIYTSFQFIFRVLS